MATQNGNGVGFDPEQLQGKRVLVYSLGIEGRDLARFMVRHGATVTVSDTRTSAQLEAAGAALPEGVTDLVSGRPLLDPEGFDLVAVSQSVLRGNAALGRARSLGVPMTSQMRLFLQLCPGKTVGITGSSGKSTTTALVGAMAAAAGLDYVVGGNLGEALLGRLDDIGAETTVILEISHTQLQYTDRSPHIAAITNVTPNHLDQFSWDEYVGLKRNILTHQTADDIAVLNADDHSSSALAGSVAGRLVRTSIAKEPAGDAVWLDGERIVARRDGHVTELARRQQIRLRGQHNVANVVMACAIGNEAGISPEAMRGRDFGVPRGRPPPGNRRHEQRRDVGERQHRHQPRTDYRRPRIVQGAGRAAARRPRQEPATRRPAGAGPPPLPGGDLLWRSGPAVP